jgi:glycosyltransferase involved in cell wall biosynthesis
MIFGRRRASGPVLGIVVPAYDVADYLPACLDSILASSHRELDVVVVDDGSPDDSGEIAEKYAARDSRVRVVHTDNRGLGAARNEGLRHVGGDYVGFADSDDVVPPTAYAALVGSLERSGSDLVTGSIARWEDGALDEPPWMRRLHHPPRSGLSVLDHPELLGDVFAWNKAYRRTFWDGAGLSWPEGVRYEDQPTTTRAFLAADGVDVLADVVYHWRIRGDGSSITQQRSSLRDLDDRFVTKRMSLATVEAYVAQRSDDPRSAALRDVFVDRVLAGDLHRYFSEIPGCDDVWWDLLRSGIAAIWGDRSLTRSGLVPAHRLIGWLVERDRRDEAAAVATYVKERGRPLDRVDSPDGVRIAVPVVDAATIDPAALLLRPHETTP